MYIHISCQIISGGKGLYVRFFAHYQLCGFKYIISPAGNAISACMSISCFEEAKRGMDMVEDDIYCMFYCDTWWDKLQTVKICLVFLSLASVWFCADSWLSCVSIDYVNTCLLTLYFEVNTNTLKLHNDLQIIFYIDPKIFCSSVNTLLLLY